MSDEQQPSLLWNWRIWLGLAVTTLAFYWTLRDVDLWIMKAKAQAPASYAR